MNCKYGTSTPAAQKLKQIRQVLKAFLSDSCDPRSGSLSNTNIDRVHKGTETKDGFDIRHVCFQFLITQFNAVTLPYLRY